METETAQQLYDRDSENFLEAAAEITFTHTHHSRKGNKYQIIDITTSENKRPGELCIKARNLATNQIEILHKIHLPYLAYELEGEPKKFPIRERLRAEAPQPAEEGELERDLSGLELEGYPDAEEPKAQERAKGRVKTPEELEYEKSSRQKIKDYGLTEIPDSKKPVKIEGISEPKKIEKQKPFIRRSGK
jgi:hypothetical protein